MSKQVIVIGGGVGGLAAAVRPAAHPAVFRVTLRRHDPIARFTWADGTRFDLRSSADPAGRLGGSEVNVPVRAALSSCRPSKGSMAGRARSTG